MTEKKLCKIKTEESKLVVLLEVKGNIHQVLLTKEESGFVFNLISQLHIGKIKVLENKLESIHF